jgi:hypothetical protein
MASKILSSLKAKFFNATTDTAIEVGTDSDTESRIIISAGGRLSWSDGASSPDVYLERSSSNTLSITGSFNATNITVNGSYSFSNSDGTDGQVIATNGSGDLYWSSVPNDNAIMLWIGL